MKTKVENAWRLGRVGIMHYPSHKRVMAYSHTVGLETLCGIPELVIVGLNSRVAEGILSKVIERAFIGDIVMMPNEEISGIANMPIKLKSVMPTGLQFLRVAMEIQCRIVRGFQLHYDGSPTLDRCSKNPKLPALAAA